MAPQRISTFLALVFFFEAGFSQGPPIYTDSPVFLGLEGRGLRSFAKYVSKKNADVLIIPIAFPYNITTDLFVGAVVPFVRKAPKGIDPAAGVGDTFLFAKQIVFQKDGLKRTTRMALKLKETFPTGNSGSTPPLGSGEYQTHIGLIAAHITTRIGLYSEIGYNTAFKEKTHQFLYNLGVGYPLMPVTYPPKQLNIYLELNGTEPIGLSQSSLFVSPGIQLIPSSRFLLETGVQIPVVEKVPDAKKTNFVFTFGTRILIF